MPFITRLREEYGNYSGGKIPDEMTASSWHDGGIKQLQSIVNAVDEYKEMKISTSKHNLAQSGTKRPCDKSHAFKLVNRLQKDYIISTYLQKDTQ